MQAGEGDGIPAAEIENGVADRIFGKPGEDIVEGCDAGAVDVAR